MTEQATTARVTPHARPSAERTQYTRYIYIIKSRLGRSGGLVSSNDGCTIVYLRGTLFGAHEDVRHILVLAQKWKVQNDLERFCVGSHHDELRYASVQSLRR